MTDLVYRLRLHLSRLIDPRPPRRPVNVTFTADSTRVAEVAEALEARVAQAARARPTPRRYLS